MAPPEKRPRTAEEGDREDCGAPPKTQLPAHGPFSWSEDFDPRSPSVKRAWDQDGYILVKGLLRVEELKRLDAAIVSDGGIVAHAYGRDDGMGRQTRMALWNHPGNDVTGMIARVPKVAGTMSALLGNEVYHYHTKLMMKDAVTGGAHLWHQDFGYWSNNGCLYPDMGTCFITLDKMDRENAGLQVIRGSHKLGLLQHHMVGGQAEADPKRREWAMQAGLEHVYVEMEPASNNPMIEHHHPRYTPLNLTSNDAICDPATPLVDHSGKDFMDPADDKSVKKYAEKGFH